MVYYFSKWRNDWVAFKRQPPTKGELLALEKYNYKIKKDE